MRAFVFTDKALERYAGQFVWLAIDTENGTNAAFLKKYPINVWPTLLIVDPKKESVALRYSGGATVPQLKKLLADGTKLMHGKQSAADEALSRADGLETAGKHAEAAIAYEAAFAAAPKDWSRSGRAAESLVFALALAHDQARCAARAAELYPRVKGTYSAANVAATGLGCAGDLKEDDPHRAPLLDTLEKASRETLDDAKIPLSGDDRSGLYETLIGTRASMKDEAGATTLRQEWATFLEAEAAKGKTAEQRAVYDPHRLGAYIALKQPEKAIPMLEQSEKDFPTDYNPPARLASAYKAMGRYDDALAANGRALQRAYGPRKIGILRNRSDLYALKGDKNTARKTMEEALQYAESLPAEQRSEALLASLRKKIATM
ncbi:MAG: tetratricopeptide repeat protein [Thermoanaerobaculia bacterium]